MRRNLVTFKITVRRARSPRLWFLILSISIRFVAIIIFQPAGPRKELILLPAGVVVDAEVVMESPVVNYRAFGVAQGVIDALQFLRLVLVIVVEVPKVQELVVYQVHVDALVQLIHHCLRRVAEHVKGIVFEGLEDLHHDHRDSG